MSGRSIEHRVALLKTKPRGKILIHEVYRSIQGESSYAGLPCVFVRLAVCDSRCSWCFVPETPVLLADWSWKSIGELKRGDAVVAVTRPGHKGSHLQTTYAHVKHIASRRARTCVVNGSVRATLDHPFWLTGKDAERNNRVHSGWRSVHRASGLRAGFLATPSTNNDALYQRGWLAGMADGDGCFWTLKAGRGYRRFRLALEDESLLDRARAFAGFAGYALRPGRHRMSGFGERTNLPCLWLTTDSEARAFESWLAEDIRHPDWFSGYLGGIIDAEGSLSGRILRIAQAPHHIRVRGRIERALRSVGIGYTAERSGFYLHRSKGALWRLLTLARPGKRSVLINAAGHNPHTDQLVESAEPTGCDEDVVAISTTAGSFIAGGFIAKNCDTPHAFNRGEAIDLDALVEQVLEFGCPMVEITGGEPMLQPEVLPFMSRLADQGLRVLLETSGAHDLSAVDERVHIIMDIKCPASGEAERNCWTNLDVLKSSDEIKFVIASRSDFDWMVDVIRRHRLEGRFTLLVSCAFGHVGPEQLASWILDSRLNLRMQLQLHKYIWDPNARGV